jgi:DNA-binding NarL/FixJ family response regulator
MCIRVLVADDQSMIRAGFRMLLRDEEGIEVVAEAEDGFEAVEKAARFSPGVVLMDIRMPKLDGLEATRRILAADDSVRILILTTFDLDEYIYEALSAGASGLRPEGRSARAAHRCDPHRRSRRRAALAGGHEAGDRQVHADPSPRRAEGARRADRARA